MTESQQKSKTRILITGGSGLIGRYLTSILLEKGYSVAHLSRKQDMFGRVRVFRWDPEKEILDPVIFDGIDFIIHLAGANIGEGRWTRNRREEIIRSRVDSLLLIHRTIADNKIPLKGIISASAIGYYGSRTTEKIFIESDLPADDFLGTTCMRWEDAAGSFEKSGIRTVKIRQAMVLEMNDSTLRRLMVPARYGFILRLGRGNQYMPWIHINDLCRIYVRAIEDESLSGAFNAAAPHHVTHDEFMKTLAGIINRPVIIPNVPSFIVSAALGKMSDAILKGSRVSSEKITGAGYEFIFGNLYDALTDLIGK